MGRAENKRAPRSDERLEGAARVSSACLAWGWFSTDEALEPGTSPVSEVRADENPASVFVIGGGKTPGDRGCECLTCLQRTVRILSQGGGTGEGERTGPQPRQPLRHPSGHDTAAKPVMTAAFLSCAVRPGRRDGGRL
ncbi:unnamed protein product [Pleuronectes platessa]|uniref:Uncharacterized protein n=1 Tax=Pleuronectes platessa TaxID=8262 RepID=A0A9N7TZL3_PLEPL|nr:unnamed protein product [Pleuronectes platessa]